MSEAAWVWKDDTQIVQNKPAISFLDVLGGSKTFQTNQVRMHNNELYQRSLPLRFEAKKSYIFEKKSK